MGGKQADMVWTDPPYGVEYTGGQNRKKRERLANDDRDIYADSVPLMRDSSAPHAVLYLWFAGAVGKPVYEAVEAAGYAVRAMLVWHKLKAHYGNFMAQYMQKHEPFLYCVKRDSVPRWCGPSNEVTVWDVEQPSVNEFHPTQKPVELAERAIRNSSESGASVLDLFAGSGTTLIAAEQTGRTAFLCELDPTYCDVIIQRWQNHTGRTAIRPERVAA